MAWQPDERSAAIGEVAVAIPSDAASPSIASETIPDQPPAFFYAMPVWGDAYVEKLCSVALPSLLAPRNIPSMPNNATSSFVIATTPADEKTIRASAIFKLLERYIRVEIRYLPDDPEGSADKHWMQTAGYRMVVEQALGRGCAIFLGPDGIFTDGLTRCLFDHVIAGKQVVFGFGPRVVEESILPDLIEQGCLTAGQPLAISPRQGAKLLMQHLHHDARVQRWTSPHFPTTPAMIVWDMPDGMLVRTFAQHPYAVDYRDLAGWKHPPYEGVGAVDGLLVKECAIAWDKIHRVSDSDEFFALSLTSMHTNEYGFEANRDLLRTLARWASSTIPAIDQWHFTNAIKVHTEDLDHRWRQLERETLSIAYSILEEARLLPIASNTPKARVVGDESPDRVLLTDMLSRIRDIEAVVAADKLCDELHGRQRLMALLSRVRDIEAAVAPDKRGDDVPNRELLTELLSRARDIAAAVAPGKRGAIRDFSDRALLTELAARVGRSIRRSYRRLTRSR